MLGWTRHQARLGASVPSEARLQGARVVVPEVFRRCLSSSLVCCSLILRNRYLRNVFYQERRFRFIGGILDISVIVISVFPVSLLM
jgi:hypothetical protein